MRAVLVFMDVAQQLFHKTQLVATFLNNIQKSFQEVLGTAKFSKEIKINLAFNLNVNNTNNVNEFSLATTIIRVKSSEIQKLEETLLNR